MAKHGCYHFTSIDFKLDERSETHVSWVFNLINSLNSFSLFSSHQQLMFRGSKVSTIVTDKKRDALMISLSRRGFTPPTATICKVKRICSLNWFYDNYKLIGG